MTSLELHNFLVKRARALKFGTTLIYVIRVDHLDQEWPCNGNIYTCKHAPNMHRFSSLSLHDCISLHNYINIVLSIVSFVLDLYLELASMPTVVMLSETIRVEWSTTL